MSKKPTKKPTKKAPKGGEANPEDEEKNLELERRAHRIESLEKELFARKEQTRIALRTKEELQARVVQYYEDLKKERLEFESIKADMLRMYTEAEKDLINKNTALEARIDEMNDQVDALKQAHQEVLKEKDAIIAEKDRIIVELKRKLEDMGVQCTTMLTQTFERINERMKMHGEAALASAEKLTEKD